MRNIIIFIDTFNSIVLTLDVVWVAIYAMQVGKQRKKFKKINKEIDLLETLIYSILKSPNSVTIFCSTAIDYDEEARYAFIGDYSGQITVCSLDGNGGVHFINALKGHNGSIQSLCWDGTKGWLYSGTNF